MIAIYLLVMFGSVAVASHPEFVGFKADPDGGAATAVLLRIAGAGAFIHAFYLLTRWEVSKLWSWQRWMGEVAMGGVTAWTFGAAFYLLGPPTTKLGLSMAGVFGGFFGQRGLVWLAVTLSRLKSVMNTPQEPPKGGGGSDS